MAKRGGKRERSITVVGLIQPRDEQNLRAVWNAFRGGRTWIRVGRVSRKVARFRHNAYGGKVKLEWWGKAIRFSVEDANASGMIAGAFLGHVQRHGGPLVKRMEVDFR